MVVRPLAILLLLTVPVMAADPKLPPGVTCEHVQANYSQWSYLGKGAIRAWLRWNGHSRADIREAEKCLK